MIADQFTKWRRRLGLTQAEVAEHMGLSKSAIEQYESGVRKGTAEPVQIPLHIELATEALTLRLAVEKSNLHLTDQQTRDRAGMLIYLLSLPTVVGGYAAGSYDTQHAALRAAGVIPEDETSFMERLFPYGDPRTIRQQMYALPKNSE